MLRSQLTRGAARAARAARGPVAARPSPALLSMRPIHGSSALRRDEDKQEGLENSFARTDPSIEVEYPQEGDLPPSAPVQGRGGLHFKRTLASFSLEGRVGVVTGGARGLGLVMSQAMVISGADVAIVDLNSGFDGLAGPSGTKLIFFRG
jgi:D-arabinitol 2-dehydrogenase